MTLSLLAQWALSSLCSNERVVMRGVFVFAVLALFAGACGGEASDSTTTSVDAVTETSGEGSTTTELQMTTTTAAPTTTTTSQAVSGGGGDSCLIGVWELDSEAFMDNLSSAFAAEADLQNVTVEFVGGSYTVTLEGNGQYTGVREEWAFQAVSPEGTFRLTIDGMDEGTWSADGPTLTISELESTASITAQAVVDGEVLDLPAEMAPTVQGDAVAEASSYECTDSRLTVSVEEGFVSEFLRIDG